MRKTSNTVAQDLSVALPMTRDCVSDIREIIKLARRSVVRHVNSTMVLAYWLVGRRLVVEEQKGKWASYGEHLLEHVSRELTAEFGRGFAEPQLRNCRLFYRAYPSEAAIRYALRIKLSWTHHRAIMRVGDSKARAYYLEEAVTQNWGTRELDRQIQTRSYWRVRNHQLPEPVVYEPCEVTPEQILKDPYVAEFLKLREPLKGKEKKVEKRIIANIEEFMLELGRGFSLVKRQYRIPLDGVNKYIDLVFYNYILRCFVLIDLKTSKLTSRDIGQMDAYRRMFDAMKRQETDNATIGILLGTEIDYPEVRFSILSECQQLFATKLMPYMPTKAELQFEIERARERTSLRSVRHAAKAVDQKGRKREA